jgi:hypothetical protein
MQESMRAIKGTKPEDEKRRKAITTEIDKKYDLSAKYAETAGPAVFGKKRTEGSGKSKLQKRIEHAYQLLQNKKAIGQGKNLRGKSQNPELSTMFFYKKGR